MIVRLSKRAQGWRGHQNRRVLDAPAHAGPIDDPSADTGPDSANHARAATVKSAPHADAQVFSVQAATQPGLHANGIESAADTVEDMRHATTSRASARHLRRRRRRAVIGIELDSTALQVAEVDSGEIVWLQTCRAETTRGAWDQWRRSRPKRFRELVPIWVGSRSHFSRLEVPRLPKSALAEYCAVSVAPELPHAADSYVTAVAADGAWRGGPQMVSVVSIPSMCLTDVWPLLHHHGASLVPAEFTQGIDGLILAARGGGATLMLRHEGAVVATRNLDCDGFDAAFGVAPTGDADGGRAVQYAPALVDQVVATVAFWRNQGLPVASHLHAYGVGSTCVDLKEAFEAVGLDFRRMPTPPGIVSTGVYNADDVLTHHGPIGAAISRPVLDGGVSNPHSERAKARKVRGGRRMAAAVTLAAAAGLFSWLALLPYLEGSSLRDGALARNRAAQAQLAEHAQNQAAVSQPTSAAAAYAAVSDAVASLHVDEPDWSAVITSLLDTVPHGTELSLMHLSPGQCPDVAAEVRSQQGNRAAEAVALEGAFAPWATWTCVDVALSARLPEQSMLLVAEWIRQIEHISGFDVLPSTLVVDDDLEVRKTAPLDVAFTLRLPNDEQFRVPRDIPGSSP